MGQREGTFHALTPEIILRLVHVSLMTSSLGTVQMGHNH